MSAGQGVTYARRFYRSLHLPDRCPPRVRLIYSHRPRITLPLQPCSTLERCTGDRVAERAVPSGVGTDEPAVQPRKEPLMRAIPGLGASFYARFRRLVVASH